MKKKGFFKFRFIKKYEVDLWGYLASCSIGKRNFLKTMLKVFLHKNRYKKKKLFRSFFFWKKKKPFLYSRKLKRKKIKKFYNRTYIKNLHTVLKFRMYYGDMTIKKFRRYLQRVNVKRLSFLSKILFLLESRLDVILCRLNFVKNPREARKYIKANKIVINGVKVNHLNHQVYIHDVIYFEYLTGILWNQKLKKNLLNNNIIFNYPRYIEMNYKLIKCMFISYPKKKEIPSLWKQNFAFLRNFI